VNTKNWIASPEFVATWKDAFRDAKESFLALSDNVSASTKRERTGRLWTLVQHPYHGIHLLAIDMQPSETPHALWLRVWVDQRHQSIYDHLLSLGAPEISGKQAIVNANQKPQPSWQSQLRKRGISLIGLSYRLSDLSFLGDRQIAGANYVESVMNFFTWLISNLGTKA